MNSLRLIPLIVGLLLSLATTFTNAALPRTPAAKSLAFDTSEGPRVALVDAQVYVGDGTVIDHGVVQLQGTRIVSVGGPAAKASIPTNAVVVDLKGHRLTPGIIAAATSIGLEEISAEPSTTDTERSDGLPIRAGYDASMAVYADSSLIPINAIEGITSAAVTPVGGLLSGQIAWIDLVAGDHQQIVVRPRIGVAGRLGASFQESRAASWAMLQRALGDARLYRDRKNAFDRRQTRDLVAHPLDLAALDPIVGGTAPLVVHADRASDLLALARLSREQGLQIVVVGATQGWKVADALAQAKVGVIVQPSANIPGSIDQIGARLDNAARLYAAGVSVGIARLNDAHNIRNVTQEAGIAVAYGLPASAALSAITLELARLYRMDEHYGSIQAGKVANLVVWDGDPFELSQWPSQVYIRGRAIPMRSRQTLLRERYRDLHQFRTDPND